MSRCYLLAMLILLLIACSAPNARVATTLNLDAALQGDLPVNPLQWSVITSGVDPSSATMYTLFGNDTAVQYARTNGERNYPAGSVLSLVTWQSQEDSRWFGARIPSRPKSVEIVTIQSSYSYKVYEGSPLKESKSLASMADGRRAYILSQRAAVMP
jgi:hypothetical protein